MPIIKSKFYKIKKDNLHNVEKLIKDLDINKIKEIEYIKLKYDDYHKNYLIEIKNIYYSIYRIPLFFFDYKIKIIRDDFEKVDDKNKYYELINKMSIFFLFLREKISEYLFVKR